MPISKNALFDNRRRTQFIENPRRIAIHHLRHILLILEQHAECVFNRVGFEREDVEGGEGVDPCRPLPVPPV